MHHYLWVERIKHRFLHQSSLKNKQTAISSRNYAPHAKRHMGWPAWGSSQVCLIRMGAWHSSSCAIFV